MQSNQFPKNKRPDNFIPGQYRRVKVWNVKSTWGEFSMYAINANAVREEFKRLRPTAIILSIERKS